MKPVYKCQCGSKVTYKKKFVSPDYFAYCHQCDEDMLKIELIKQTKKPQKRGNP